MTVAWRYARKICSRLRQYQMWSLYQNGLIGAGENRSHDDHGATMKAAGFKDMTVKGLTLIGSVEPGRKRILALIGSQYLHRIGPGE
jgi:hypothetical protein